MKPAAIGSPTAAMTMGMVLVALRAASVDSVPAVNDIDVSLGEVGS